MNVKHLTDEEIIDILVTGKSVQHIAECPECGSKYNFIKKSLELVKKNSFDSFNLNYDDIFFQKQKIEFFEKYETSRWKFRFFSFLKPLSVGFATLFLVFALYNGLLLKQKTSDLADVDDETILLIIDKYIDETGGEYNEEKNFN